MHGWALAVVLVAAAACGSRSADTLDGKCSPGAAPDSGGALALWTCTTAYSDASQVVPQCPSDLVLSGPCVTANFVGTANPMQPFSLVSSGCFLCSTSGLGTIWSCDSQSWTAAGTFLCHQ